MSNVLQATLEHIRDRYVKPLPEKGKLVDICTLCGARVASDEHDEDKNCGIAARALRAQPETPPVSGPPPASAVGHPNPKEPA